MKKMKFRISFFFVLMVISLILTHSYLSLAALLAAFLHELGHIFIARGCSLPLSEMKLDIFGAALTPESSLCSYKKEIFLALGGPLVNLLSFALLYPLRHSLGDFGGLFLSASLFLGVLNLLPIADMDGGRILRCLLMLKCSPHSAEAVSKAVSLCIAFCLWLLSVYFLLRLSASLSLFVFSLALFAKILMPKKS